MCEIAAVKMSDDAFTYFSDLLMSLCKKYIPQQKIMVKKQSHPWINQACVVAIRAKNASEGLPSFPLQRDRCSHILAEAYRSYVQELKAKLVNLSKSDKQWWRINRELLNKKARLSSIPPLRDDDGNWNLDAHGKANLFANTWVEKCKLPPDVEDQFVARPVQVQQEFIAIRTRAVYRELSKLDVNKSTGPDQIGARILKELAHELAIPVAILSRRMLYEGCWPALWRVHHLAPVYKRKSMYNAGNYRGVHLTATLSKAVERVIGNPLIAYLQQFGYGTNQWGFRKSCSARDLTFVCVSSWILAICSGFKIGAYLSDITSAFDRVFKDYLLAKLHSVEIADVFLDFLRSYLEPRIGHVRVDEILSEAFELCNTVF